MDGPALGLPFTGELIVMMAKTRVQSIGIVLLVCLACVLPAPALDPNPLSYIFGKPAPAPTITRAEVRDVHTIVPVRTMTPVPFLTSSPVNEGIAPATPQTGDGVMLKGTVTELAYSPESGLGFAFLTLSDGSGTVVLVSELPAGDLMYDLFRTAYLKGNVLKAYTDNPVRKMEIAGFSGPEEYVLYTPDSFDLGPIHGA